MTDGGWLSYFVRETPNTASPEPAIFKLAVKTINIPLFGVLDAEDQEPFHAAFAASGQRTTLEFDEHAFQIIEHQLALDAEQLLPAASRYLTGALSGRSQGLRGWHLGDFGEAVVLVLHLLRIGWTVSRVVSSHAPNHAERPMPDFWGTDPAGHLCLIEVKSTEALDYLELSQSHWKSLGPCRSVGPLRLKALRQLGLRASGRDRGYRHHIDVLGRGRQQFPLLPSRKGIVWIVMARDGRLLRLQGQKRFKTPAACAARHRDCWECIGAAPARGEHDVIAVELENAPGYLPLLPPGERGGRVFGAYRWWTEALWAAEVSAVKRSSSELARALLSWIAELETGVHFGSRLRREWRDYIAGGVAASGVGGRALPDLESLARGSAFERGEEEEQLPGAARVVPPDVIQAILRVPVEERRIAHLSASIPADGEEVPDTISVRTSPGGWSARVCSRRWWRRQMIDGLTVSDLVHRVLKFLVGDRDLAWNERSPVVLPVFAKTPDGHVELGWRLVSSWEGASPLALGDLPTWLAWLSSGDPRASLYVFPDGRLSLTIHGELPPQIGPRSTAPLPDLDPPATVPLRRLALTT